MSWGFFLSAFNHHDWQLETRQFTKWEYPSTSPIGARNLTTTCYFLISIAKFQGIILGKSSENVMMDHSKASKKWQVGDKSKQKLNGLKQCDDRTNKVMQYLTIHYVNQLRISHGNFQGHSTKYLVRWVIGRDSSLFVTWDELYAPVNSD